MTSPADQLANLSQPSGAVFSPCDRYRYVLWRTWKPHIPSVVFIGLNPSTADAQRNDPTIRRCIGFAQTWGYGGIIIANLFSYRATQPNTLRQVSDPVGPDTDQWLQWICQKVSAPPLAADQYRCEQGGFEQSGFEQSGTAPCGSRQNASKQHDFLQTNAQNPVLLSRHTTRPAHGLIVAAWGNRGQLLERDRTVLELIAPVTPTLYCLALTRQHQPTHPLYQRKTLCPMVYFPAQRQDEIRTVRPK